MAYSDAPPNRAQASHHTRPAFSRSYGSLSKWVMGMFLIGIFVDYGGGLGIKLPVTLIALLWVLLCKVTPSILYRFRADLFIFLGLPALISLLHLFSVASAEILRYVAAFYSTVSSALLLLLLPLVWLTGARRTQHMVLIGMIGVAAIMIILATLHYLGIIDLYNYSDLARDYRLGYIGIDPRQQGADFASRPLVSFRVAFTLVLGFGLALGVSRLYAGVIAIGLILLLARGMWLGTAIVFFLWMLTGVRNPRRIRFKTKKLLQLGAVLVLGIGVVFYSDIHLLLWKNVLVVLERFEQQSNFEDVSTLVRLGHLEGYTDLIYQFPIGLFIGFGPNASIQNSQTGQEITLTEISILNIMIWYGVIYAAIFSFWLLFSAYRLWRLRRMPGYGTEDTALIVGAVGFWLAANTNPLLNSPMAFIALMIIRIRTLELQVGRDTVKQYAQSRHHRS